MGVRLHEISWVVKRERAQTCTDSVIGIVDLDHIGIGIKRHLILKNVVNFAFFILKQPLIFQKYVRL